MNNMDIQKKRPILFNMENLNTNTINDDLFDDDGEFEKSIFKKFNLQYIFNLKYPPLPNTILIIRRPHK